ncbi:MAG: N utilization substance protein B, partial [gamma proteobacterium symbiont of Ctena orbiculata]
MSEKRSQARKHAVQAIYQWQMAGQDVADIINQFLEEQDLGSFEIPYFRELMKGVPGHLGELDELLKPTLDRAIESVEPV